MTNAVSHAYLMEPGLWEVNGIYYDANDNPFPQKGQVVITHTGGLWVVEGDLTIITHETQQISSRAEVQPLAPGASFTEWRSEAGGPEPVLGLFVLVDEVIMSPWQSRSGAYWGQEILRRLSDDVYEGRGFAFLDNKKVSAWSTSLKRN